MSVKLSGLSSNLDTESIIKSLVSAYSVTKDNLVKAQTKLSWKQDSWKSMNTKIYTFYSKSLTNMRLSSSYNKKIASASDATIAKVTASAGAVSGSQSLEVKKLASSGYLTGGSISTETKVDGVTKTGKVTGDSKLSEIKGLSLFEGGSFSVGVGEKSTTIDMTKDTTVTGLVSKLKAAGVNASFDATNQRFFISAKSSGADSDFTMTASNGGGLSALQSMGLYTINDTDKAEYTKWAGYSAAEIATLKTDTYNASVTNSTKVSAEYKNTYDTASNNVNTLKATNAQLTTENNALDAQLLDPTNTLTEADKKAINDQKTAIGVKITTNDAARTTYENTMKDNEPFVILAGDSVDTISAKTEKINIEVASRNAVIKTNVEAAIDEKIATAPAALAVGAGSTGAVRTVGADSQIILNGATFNSSSNNYNINGLTIQALNKTETGKPITVTSSTDVDGIYDMIKGFFTGYNELINGLDSAYNASSAKGYEPLTADEKDAMTDTEVETWEKKVKDALLRKDSTVNSVSTSLKTDMLGSFTTDGVKANLATFGINTLSYFTSAENEKGAYHIDGDPKDSDTSGSADKLRAAIANDPEGVTSFFSQLSSSIYTDLTARMKSSTLRSAYTIYNDKQLSTEYSQYNTKITGWEEKISTMEDYYNKKFSAMETAMSKLNSNSASLTSILGS